MGVWGGIGVLAAAAAAAVVLIARWARLAAPAAFGGLVVCGACIGVGALLVQEAPGAGDWVIAPVVLGTLTPIHARLLLGRPGTRR